MTCYLTKFISIAAILKIPDAECVALLIIIHTTVALNFDRN